MPSPIRIFFSRLQPDWARRLKRLSWWATAFGTCLPQRAVGRWALASRAVVMVSTSFRRRVPSASMRIPPIYCFISTTSEVGAEGIAQRFLAKKSAPATERGTRSRSLRGTILARTPSSCAHDHDRLRVPPASSPRTSGAEKKRINGPPPQPTLPAVRHAIVELILQPPPQRCPYCKRRIVEKQRRE